jgi:hypothetical protein
MKESKNYEQQMGTPFNKDPYDHKDRENTEETFSPKCNAEDW